MANGFGLGLNTSDFGRLANEWNPATLDQGAAEAAAAAQQISQQAASAPPPPNPIQKLGDIGARMAAESKAQESPAQNLDWAVKHDANGQPQISINNLSPDQLQYFQKAASFYQEALGGYAKEAQRLEMQRQQAESQPWQQLATALSANLAQAKDMPGWVQGLGRTAAQLNPTVDELRARQMAVLGKGAEMAEKGMAMGIAQERTIEDRAARKEAEFMRSETQRKLSVERAIDNASAAIKAGTGEVDGGAIMHGIAVAGATPQELESAAGLLGGLAANVKQKWTVERDDRVKAQTLAEKNFNQREENITRLGKQFVETQTNLEKRQTERLRQTEFLSQKSDYNKNTTLSTAEQAAVASGFNVLNLVDKLEAEAGKKKVNPITGRIQYINPFRPAEWQAIQLFSNQMLLSGLAGKLGAGVSDRDVALMREMVPSGKMTQEQFDATNRILRSINTDNLRGLMRANPNIQQWKTMEPQFKKVGLEKFYQQTMTEMKSELGDAYPALFGQDRPAIAERTFGADTKTGDDAPPISLLKEGELTTFRDGSGWTLRNGQRVKVK